MIYHGETECMALKKNKEKCVNKAYYQVEDKYFCGVHSSKKNRTELKKNPNRKQLQLELIKQRQELVEKVAKENREEKKSGTVICTKLRMMKEPEQHDGFLKVFPNYKHQNRQDGFGCASLSPKSMGPIDSGQPDLPIAKNLENFHQGNKVFPGEVDRKGNILDIFFETQEKMYNDPVPHRHKENATGNVPLFSVWKRKDGTIVKLSYFESRQFYCHYYEKIAMQLPDFIHLKKLKEDGYNLQICGYDAYPVDKDIEECYKDISKPFGHELVLYTLLTHKKRDYPWRKYNTELKKDKV